MKITAGILQKNKSGLFIFIISTCLFIYVCLRAYFIAFTWDEAFSYLEFINKKLFSPFYFTSVSANNHLLNTWLAYLSSMLFGSNEFALRLPNAFACLLFLFFTAKISNEFHSPLLKVSSFLVLNLNHYMVDYFSMSRGYGLSFGLMAGSLWYLYLFLKTNFQKKYSLFSILFAIISTFAYLALIHFSIALFVLIIIIDFLNEGQNLNSKEKILAVIQKNKIIIFSIFIFLLIIIPRIIGLKNAEALFYGGKAGFWNNTVLSVFGKALYGKIYMLNFKFILSCFSIIIFIVSFFISVKIIYRKNILPERFFLSFLCLLILYCSTVSVLQHHILHTPYLANRTALYLLILFSFMLVFLLNELALTNKLYNYFLHATAVLLTLHFCSCINLKYVFEYYPTADMKEMMHDIDSLKIKTPVQKFSTDAGVSYDFLESFNYYRSIDKLSGLNIADKEKKYDPLNDYFLFTDKDYKKINADSFVVIKAYPLFNSRLLKRKYKASEYTICLAKKLDYDSSNDSLPLGHSISGRYFYSNSKSGMTDEATEYSDGIIYKIDLAKTPVKSSMLLVKAMVLMEQLDNSEAGIIVSFEHNKEIYSWHSSHANDFVTKPKEWYPVYYSGVIPGEVQQDDLLLIYLWNKKSPVYIDDLQMRWITGVY